VFGRAEHDDARRLGLARLPNGPREMFGANGEIPAGGNAAGTAFPDGMAEAARHRRPP